ncbi:hypothetical protein [Candidatus Marithrix sp. Canyon 246]|uniref:hypothetical protein n=1 Tax=Candidatus Marithrix sp. Canyon 246 TaxID=1827136 RepID=UPI00084A12B3|nr:hypothetical protein [Candidatus Marithrix sp. Canyon 246]
MRKKKKQSQTLSPANAAKLLSNHKYKDAIAAYKKLLKSEPRQEWSDALAKAYLLRSHELANKGMYKEAAALWEIRNKPDNLDQYIFWLIKAESYTQAARFFIESNDSMPELNLLFGMLLAAGVNGIEFPEDHILVKHLVFIKDALSSYEQTDYEACKAALKQIPFRSPYRDYSTIIKGLISIETDASLQLFNKIPADSPYKNLATVISLSTNSLESIVNKQLNPAELALIASLKGWNNKQINIINQLRKPHNNKTLLEIVIKNWQLFGKEKSSQFCLALLPHYPRGIKAYESEFGSLSSFEKNRILAIRSEQDEADKYWRKCIKYLKQEQNNELKIAFIYRHLAELSDNEEDIVADLEASLLYDPADKNTYLNLVKWYEDEGELKPYHKCVDTALKQLPTDPDILLLAMASATRKKAFKKAVKFAQSLLKIDPINAKARDCAIASHISHARKSIKTKKYHLAVKELDSAMRLEKKSNGIVQINQALLAIHTSDNQAMAIKKFEKQFVNDDICDQFRIIVESKRQFLDLKLTKQNLIPNKNDALKLLNIINAYLEQKVDCLNESVQKIKPTIIKMAKLDFSQDEMLSLCECFKDLANYDLLGKFATTANKRWSNHPAFMFYEVYAEIDGKIFNLEPYQFQIIDEAMSIANTQGDNRTAMMIINFMIN